MLSYWEGESFSHAILTTFYFYLILMPKKSWLKGYFF